MASMWRRAMHYLGLGPDDEYDDYDEYDVSERQRPLPPRYTTPGVPRPSPEARGTVRTLPPTHGDDMHNGNGNGRHDPHHAYAPRPAVRDRSERKEPPEPTPDRPDRLGAHGGDRANRDRPERDRGAVNGDRPA